MQQAGLAEVMHACTASEHHAKTVEVGQQDGGSTEVT